MLCHVLAEREDRVWLAFRQPTASANGARVMTHYVVCSSEEAILIDPGGTADFGPLLDAVSDKISFNKISAIVVTLPAAHTMGSIGLWAEVLGHDTPIYAAERIAADLLHTDTNLEIVHVSENGGEVPMADGSGLHLIPAPYLPTAASMSLYDPVAQVLYSGDLGTTEGAWSDDETPFCEQFSLVSHAMNAFHQVWLPSSIARNDWLARIDDLSVDIVAPRAGPCLSGKNVEHFKRWLASMDLGVLVASPTASFLAGEGYNPHRTQVDDDVVDQALLDEGGLTPEPDSAIASSFAAKAQPSVYDEIEDNSAIDTQLAEEDNIARLLDALRNDDDDDRADTPEFGIPVDETKETASDVEDEDDLNEDVDEFDDDDEYEIVYVDEDGNEIDPSELDDDDILEGVDIIEGNDEQRLDFPPGQMFRLITRSDFDGLVCAVLLEELNLINDIIFVHPNQMQEGEIDVSETDILTNLPYTPGIFAAFDHHLSEIKRLGKHFENHIIDPLAPSAARVVYDYFGGKKRFPDISVDMMDAVDKGDSARFNQEEVLNPAGWSLLNFIMDSRTGLGRYRGFRVPNYELMMSLIDYCRRYDINDILQHPDVKERVDLFLEHQEPAKEQIKRCTTVHGNLAVIDYREEEQIYVANRFLIYALYPECNISMHVLWGRAEQNTVFAVGKSIFNRTSETNIGELMLTYGGGGHRNLGTCQSDNALADIVRDALVQRINDDG